MLMVGLADGQEILMILLKEMNVQVTVCYFEADYQIAKSFVGTTSGDAFWLLL